MSRAESTCCPQCGTERNAKNMYSDASKPDGLTSWCKSCRNERKRWGRQWVRVYQGEKNLKKVINTKACRGCGKGLGNRGNHYDNCLDCFPSTKTPIGYCGACGKVFPASSGRKFCNDECFAVSESRRKALGKSGVKELCREYKRRLRKTGCVLCGYSMCLTALEFHHIGQDKGVTLSMVTSLKRLQREIRDKVIVVLCANCHREVHAGMVDENSLRPRRLVNFREQIIMFPTHGGYKRK